MPPSDHVPDGWDEELRARRAAAERRQKLAMKCLIPFGLGLLVLGFGIFLGPLLLGWLVPVQWIVGTCFALAFVSGGGMAASLVIHETAKVNGRYVFGGPSMFHMTNRTLLRDGPDRLAVRLRPYLVGICLMVVAMSLPFFLVAGAAFQEPMTPTKTSRGGKGPPWLFGGVAFGTGGLLFLSVGTLPIVLGRRIDFDRRSGTFRVWNWLGGRTLPLGMIDAVEVDLETATYTDDDGHTSTTTYREIDLVLADASQSRVHVMNASLYHVGFAQTLSDWLGTRITGDAVPSSHVHTLRRLPSLRARWTVEFVAFALMLFASHRVYRWWNPPPPPPPDIGALERFEGVWTGTFRTPNGREFALERVARRDVGGRFLRVVEVRRSLEPDARVVGKAVLYWRFDPEAEVYHGLRLGSNGPVSRMKAEWNADENALTATTLDGRTRMEQRLPDESSLSGRLNDAGPEWTLSRADDAAGERILRNWETEDALRVLRPGEQLLSRRIGTWAEKLRFGSGARIGTFEQTGRWALGGRYLQLESRSEEGVVVRASYARYDADSERYRMWMTDTSGHVSQWEGKTLHGNLIGWTARRDDGTSGNGIWNTGGVGLANTEMRFGKTGEESLIAKLKRDPEGRVPPPPFFPPNLAAAGLSRGGHAPLQDDPLRPFVESTGVNLLATAKPSDIHGSDPTLAFDGDPATTWLGGTRLRGTWDEPVTIRRIVVRQRGDRLRSIRIKAQPTDGGEPVDVVSATTTVLFPKGDDLRRRDNRGFVNGDPFAEYVRKQLLGTTDSDLVVTFDLPEPLTTTELQLLVTFATAAPVQIAEFEAYAE